MTANKLNDGITFAVHDVSPATELKPHWKTYEGINALLTASEGDGFRPILSCSGYNSNTIGQITHHALIEAVHTAFSEHRPLVLSPDMLWITIVQGLAQHIRNNPEQLRKRLVSHQGRMQLVTEIGDFDPDSPESDWQGLIDSLGNSLRGNIGEAYDQLMCDFSTTGALEKTVCAITILDAYEPFFEYVIMCICGIPAITLEGTVSDWQRVREKIEVLAHYEMDWWLTRLRPIFDQFVRAAQGDIDLEYWQNIYKLKKAYGSDRINGWAAHLIPYIRHGMSGSFSVVNPLLESPFTVEVDVVEESSPSFFASVPGLTSDELPSGLAVVPVKFKTSSSSREMQLIGGFVGIEQVGDSNAIRPKLGWAVRQANKLDALMANLPGDNKVLPPRSADEFDQAMKRLTNSEGARGVPLPGGLATFYRKCDGVVFGAAAAGRFRSIFEWELISLTDEDFSERKITEDFRIQVDNRTWLLFFDLPDGTGLVVNVDDLSSDEQMKKGVRQIHLQYKSSKKIFDDIGQALETIIEKGGCI